jgi:hypothetical protein
MPYAASVTQATREEPGRSAHPATSPGHSRRCYRPSAAMGAERTSPMAIATGQSLAPETSLRPCLLHCGGDQGNSRRHAGQGATFGRNNRTPKPAAQSRPCGIPKALFKGRKRSKFPRNILAYARGYFLVVMVIVIGWSCSFCFRVRSSVF